MAANASIGLLNRIEPYDSTTDWVTYEERMNQFMLATGNREDNAKKVAVFLTVIGAETYSLLRDLVHPKKPSSLTYGVLTTKLREQFISNLIQAHQTPYCLQTHITNCGQVRSVPSYIT